MASSEARSNDIGRLEGVATALEDLDPVGDPGDQVRSPDRSGQTATARKLDRARPAMSETSSRMSFADAGGIHAILVRSTLIAWRAGKALCVKAEEPAYGWRDAGGKLVTSATVRSGSPRAACGSTCRLKRYGGSRP